MKERLKNIKASFNNESIGYSGRKLSAFLANIILLGLNVAYCWNGVKRGEFLDFPTVNIIITVYSSLLLGLITADKIITLKNGYKYNKENPEPKDKVQD
jgi:hypothetical protein